MFTRISKREAIKRFNAGLPFVLCPVKLRPSFPWAPHCYISSEMILESKMDAIEYGGKAWDALYDSWAHYNTSWEAGYYAAYYLED